MTCNMLCSIEEIYLYFILLPAFFLFIFFGVCWALHLSLNNTGISTKFTVLFFLLNQKNPDLFYFFYACLDAGIRGGKDAAATPKIRPSSNNLHRKHINLFWSCLICFTDVVQNYVGLLLLSICYSATGAFILFRVLPAEWYNAQQASAFLLLHHNWVMSENIGQYILFLQCILQ